MVKLSLAFLVLVVGIVALIYVVDPYQIYKETSFNTFYDNLSSSIKKLDCVKMYSYKSEAYQDRVTFDYYVLNCEGEKSSLSESIIIHNLWVINDTGYADRTRISCLSADCTGDGKIENREIKRYNFIRGKWTLADDDQPLQLATSN